MIFLIPSLHRIIVRTVFVALLLCSAHGCAPIRSTVAQDHGIRQQDSYSCHTRMEGILRDPALRHSFVGIKALSLASGESIYELHSDKLFRLASNIKLFTTAAALELLGGDFRFSTEVYADSTPASGVLFGNLYLKGYGDPLLRTEHLDSLAIEVYNRGIREITGDIVGDVSYFDDRPWGKGWMWDDESEPWHPRISALSVHSGIVSVTVAPGLKPGAPPMVFAEPSGAEIAVANRGLTSSDTNDAPLRVTYQGGNEHTIVIEGTILSGSPSRKFEFSTSRPELVALSLFRNRLEVRGIRTAGKTRLGPTAGTYFISSVSNPLDSVVFVVNKMSHNLGAESLLKSIAAERRSRPGVADSGIAVVRAYLSSIGVDTALVHLADGSGISRYSLASPSSIVQLLRYMHARSPHFPSFYNSLAIAGVDGTLRNRMRNSPLQGAVRARTGTYSDGVALSGYLTRSDGEIVAFSIFINNFLGEQGTYRTILDRIVETLYACRHDHRPESR